MKYLSLVLLTAMLSLSANAEEREFGGINFGVGISLTSDIGNNSRITNASLDANGIVRVAHDNDSVARIMLETHYFFETPENADDPWSFLGMVIPDKWGHGPFLAIQPGTDEIIEAIGFGWMVGFRKNEENNESWNVGLGYIVDPSVQVLGDGISENAILPDGESEIRFKNTSQDGVFLIFSFTF